MEEPGYSGLITSIVGSSLGATLIYLGIISKVYDISSGVVYFIFIPLVLYTYPVLVPNFFYIWLGLVVLAITFIMLGVSTLAMRETFSMPSAVTAAGVLSIVGGCFLFPYVLVWMKLIPLLGVVFAFIGFAMILVVFIIWTIVFYSSRNL